MTKWKQLLMTLLAFPMAFYAFGNPAPKAAPAIAAKIFDELYQAAGQYNVKKPKFEYSFENKRGAAYFHSKNTVVLDDKTYRICQGMGKDSSASLAFVLAHELSHAFYTDAKKNRKGTDFLAYDQHFESDIQSEKVADINGVFTAYLAGYRLSTVIPKFLPKLYEAYGLSGRVLKGYPPLEERTRTAKEVLEITDDLIGLYETSNYLLVAGRYDMAITNYEYILQYYQGREVFNNLGVLYLFKAMEFYLLETDNYVYPIELDASTLLKKIEIIRAPPKELTLTQKLERMNRLNMAQKQFMLAIALDPSFTTAKINYACTLILLQKPTDAKAYLSKRKFLKKTATEKSQAEKVQLILAISDAVQGSKAAAKTAFQAALKSKTPTVAAAADFNLEVLEGKEPKAKAGAAYPFPSKFTTLAKAITMPTVSHLACLDLDDKGSCLRHLEQGETETFSFGNKRGNVLSIIRFKNKMAPELDLLELSEPLSRSFFNNLVSTPGGYYLKSADGIIVLKVNDKGKVEEIAKLEKHN
jgi:tetratricopeptide (TPR) repeat protein